LNQNEKKIKPFENEIMKKDIDQIMVEKVYLWIILCLKFTFDIFFPSNQSSTNYIRIYECLQNKLYIQNIILSLLHDCIHNINK
jgi:hypothetical protein